MKTIIKVYKRHGWRWQMRDTRNGRIIGASTEGYTRQSASPPLSAQSREKAND